ncbi:MAG: ABC transporter substrate-binding protein [Defluviitaleaceae bacterium]|nr:ABC transporter substrate-binding protein [Defluviitaleaceae bacterium]MCL2273875.1 ABC transporter substrate-binding protein [Defluviitaleaceae bacterium]
MKKFAAIIFTGMLVLMLGALSACGSDSDYAQGVTGDTITVGNTAATSGGFAMVGVPFNDGIRAYFHRVNEAGGVHGRQLRFVHHDDGFDPINGLAFTEALIHDDQVFAIVGHFGTPTIGATLGLLRETGIPTVYFASGIGALFSDDAFDNARGRNIFPVQAIFVTEGRVLAARAIEEYNARTIGVIYTSDEAGMDYLRGVRMQIEAMGAGFSIVEHQISPGQADVSSAVLDMIHSDVDVVIAAMSQISFIIVANAMANAGLTVPVFTSYVSADAVAIHSIAPDYIGAGATFPIYSTAWLDPDGIVDFMDFVDGVTAFGDPTLAGSAFAMAGWVAASTFVQGLQATDPDDLTWDGFISAMERTPISVPMAGVMDFSNGQRTGTEYLALLRVNFETQSWDTVRPLESLHAVLARVGN